MYAKVNQLWILYIGKQIPCVSSPLVSTQSSLLLITYTIHELYTGKLTTFILVCCSFLGCDLLIFTVVANVLPRGWLVGANWTVLTRSKARLGECAWPTGCCRISTNNISYIMPASQRCYTSLIYFNGVPIYYMSCQMQYHFIAKR